MMKFCASLFALLVILAVLPTTEAQNLFWDVDTVASPGAGGGGSPNGTWNVGITPNWGSNQDGLGNEVPGVWSNGNTAVFSAGSDATGSYTITVSGAPSATGMTFEEGSLVTVTGGTVTLTGTPIVSTASSAQEVHLDSVLAGTDGVTFSGSGVVQLGGANTYSGLTTAALGGTLKLGAAGVIPDASVLTIPQGNTQTQVQLNGFNETVRSINSTGTGGSPTMVIGTNTLTINDQAGDTNTYTGLYSTTAGGKIIKNGDGTLILNNFPTGFAGGEFIVNSGTIGIGQNNVFGTNANGGKLTINPNNLATGPTLKRTGATINLTTPMIDIGGNFTYDNNGGSDTQLNGLNGASTTTLKADNPVITVTGDQIVDGTKSSGVFIFAGDIVDDGNIRGFTKSGPGTMTLGSSLNSYRGETTITQGALNVRYQTNSARVGFARIGDGTGRVNLSGGTLSYNGSAHTSGTPAVTDQPRHFTVTNPIRVTADSTIAYASTSTGLTDAIDNTNGAGPDGVVFEFTSNTVDTTGGTLTLRHNGLSQGLTYRPTFSGSGFNYTGPVVISGAGTRKTVFQSSNTSGTQTWSGPISGTGSYRRSGAGATVFNGANTFSGGTIVDGGTLTASGASATLGGGDVTVNAGSAAISAGVANAILNTAKLTLLGGGIGGVADAGFISLAAGINEQVGALVLGAAAQANGTYGSMASAATFKNDEYFSGTGIITVTAAGLPGDYNNNGVVDAGDYVLWRKSPGTYGGDPAGYTTWRANFSSPPGAGSGGGLSGGTVPEPGTLLLLICAVGACLATSSRAICRRGR